MNPELNPVVARDSAFSVNWSYKTGAGISSSPTVSRGTLFVASNDGKLYAFDLQTGRVKWRFAAEN
ncbi:MAG: PQQ-binding-like beta-propeller repeat protein, partial [Rhodanobacteraceae bacterium]